MAAYASCEGPSMAHCTPDKPREECGVFGVYGKSPGVDAASLTYLGLYALQHRGQESAGMATSDGRSVVIHKEMGLVAKVFPDEVLSGLGGHISVGHVRYSTTGSSRVENAQPLLGRCKYGPVAIAHNGNLVNTLDLFKELEAEGSVFQSTLDTEVVLHLVARSEAQDVEEAVRGAARRLQGAYSIIVLAGDKLMAMRDPHAIRPLCLGESQDAYFISSETCGLDTVGARLIRHVGPGEMVTIDGGGVRFSQAVPARRRAVCVFEFIYFARPDSEIDGVNVHLARKRMGQALAHEYPVEADMVIAAPDSGISAAIGFAEALGIPYDTGLTKNRYVGRTFIQPSQTMRELGVRIKLNPIADLVAGKRVVMIDDSIVRGTTSVKTIEMLRSAGAREVHMYVASPPVRYPCYYGIDTSARGELIASNHTIDEIREHLRADSLCYLSLEGLIEAMGPLGGELCLACLDGRYPVELPDAGAGHKHVLERCSKST